MKIKNVSRAVCILVALLGLCIAFFMSEVDADDNYGLHKINPHLNSRLTNEISEIESLKGMDKSIVRFMGKWGIKGLSLSIMRNDSLLFAKGYGWADEEKGKEMKPSSLMRLASVSKLVTATGIMVLIEQGKLSLKDTVFGSGKILSDDLYLNSIKDRNYYKITVEDLLRHKAGFTLRGGDPMFSTREIMLRHKLKKSIPPDSLIKYTLKRKLGYVPGKSRTYSNFGYFLLSRIIEEVSGESYENFIRKNVLKPAGCTDFHIAKNYYRNRYRNEVRYYVPGNTPLVPEYTNSGNLVERCYGGSDIEGLSGAGAWVASVPELCLFVASIDGHTEVPDIISKESVNKMTKFLDKKTFALGWNNTNPKNGWTRTGTLASTSALIKYFPDGECWILVTNTGTWKGPKFTRQTTALFSTLRRKYSSILPKRNLFCKNAE